MLVPLSWLKQYVDVAVPTTDLAERLSLAGLEVEGIEKVGDDEVLNIAITPDAARCLSVIGVAREVAAITKTSIKLPADDFPVSGTDQADGYAEDRSHRERHHQDACGRSTATFGEDVADVHVEGPRRAVALLKSGKRIVADLLLYSIGRIGATPELDLPAAGLTADDRVVLTTNGRAVPGGKVVPKETSIATPPAAAIPAAATPAAAPPAATPPAAPPAAAPPAAPTK